MNDLISRQDAKRELQEKVFRNLTGEFYGTMQVLDELPSAERNGHWESELASNGWKDIRCSECGWTKNVDVHVSLGYNFCPNCGARMKGEEE